MKGIFIIQIVLVVVFNISIIQTATINANVDISSEDFTALTSRVDGMENKIYELNSEVGSIRTLMRRQVSVEEILNEIQYEVYNIKRHQENVNNEFRSKVDGMANKQSRTEMDIAELNSKFGSMENVTNILNEIQNEVYNKQRDHENINNTLTNAIQQIKQTHDDVVHQLNKDLQEMKQDHETFRNQTHILNRERDELQNETNSLKRKVDILLKMQEEHRGSRIEESQNVTTFQTKGNQEVQTAAALTDSTTVSHNVTTTENITTATNDNTFTDPTIDSKSVSHNVTATENATTVTNDTTFTDPTIDSHNVTATENATAVTNDTMPTAPTTDSSTISLNFTTIPENATLISNFTDDGNN